MEQKKDSIFKKITKIYFICLGLYIPGWLPVMATDLGYRMWNPFWEAICQCFS